MDKLPITTHECIIIPVNLDLHMFSKNSYNKDFLEHLLKDNVYNEIIEKGTRIMGLAWSKKRNNDVVRIPRTYIFLSILSIIFAVLFMIFMFVSTYNDSNTLLILSIISITFSTTIAFAISIFNYLNKLSKFVALDEYIKKDLDTYFNKINAQYLGRLEFNFKGFYLECKILEPIDDDKAKRIKAQEAKLKKNQMKE